MSTPGEKLRPGDVVELRPPAEIAATLDSDGVLHDVLFMPEMLDFYGQRLRVARRALTVCYYGPGSSRTFRTDTVVTLEGVRCSGSAHERCPKACTIFWCEAWLRRADAEAPGPVDSQSLDTLRSRLTVMSGPAIWRCQASELLKATRPMSPRERVTHYARGLIAGNFGVRALMADLPVSLYWWARRRIGIYPRGGCKPNASDTLGLRPGEWVEVKPLREIIATLDERGQNNRLPFTPDMRRWCGRKARVKQRLDKIIVDGTGRTRKLRDTVTLEGSTCGCAFMNLGLADCSRCEFTYWREIWLRRCAPDAQSSSVLPAEPARRSASAPAEERSAI